MPEATVAAIVTQAGGSGEAVLLTRRACEPFKDQWCLPGGHIDLDEPARHAIIREVKEETGLDFKPQFFGYFDEIIPSRGIHAVVMVFTGRAAGELKGQSVEVANMAWFSVDEARSFELAFTHDEILAAYVAQRVNRPKGGS